MCELNRFYVVTVDAQGFVRVALCVPDMCKLTPLGFKVLVLKTKT